MKLPDSNAAKLGAYAVALVVTFGAAFVLGGAVGPVAADADGEHSSSDHVEPGMMDEHGMDELVGDVTAGTESDLAYLHTHPAEEAGAGDEGGPAVEFGTEFPTPGTYRLFAERPGASRNRTLAGVDMDFQHEGAVHTAEFTVIVSG